jgi:hypothetical protein
MVVCGLPSAAGRTRLENAPSSKVVVGTSHIIRSTSS